MHAATIRSLTGVGGADAANAGIESAGELDTTLSTGRDLPGGVLASSRIGHHTRGTGPGFRLLGRRGSESLARALPRATPIAASHGEPRFSGTTAEVGDFRTGPDAARRGSQFQFPG